MFYLFKAIGAIGLLFIIGGLLSRTRRQQVFLYMFGGIFLEVYSIYLADEIFIALQAVFTAIAAYEFYRYKKERESWIKHIFH
ncbi:MAG: hypothetical protein GXO64_01640 [Candidatus Micrarchaeota archaeon]|nr:hypothetical protein [Candidatus Micrarchaeota archaeon]